MNRILREDAEAIAAAVLVAAVCKALEKALGGSEVRSAA